MSEERKTREKSTDIPKRTRNRGISVQHVESFSPATKTPRTKADSRSRITPRKSSRRKEGFWMNNRIHCQGVTKDHSHTHIQKEKLGGNIQTGLARDLLDKQAHISLQLLLQSVSDEVYLGLSMLIKHGVAFSHGIPYVSSLSKIGLADLDQLQSTFDRLALSLHQTYQFLLGQKSSYPLRNFW
jgi:hypothetical protein